MICWHPRDCEKPGLAFLVDYNIEWQSTDLYIAMRNADGTVACAKPIEMEAHEPGTRMTPCLRIPDREGPNHLQHLFDALWDIGLRPQVEKINVEAVVQAKNENLADLRSIINKLMETT